MVPREVRVVRAEKSLTVLPSRHGGLMAVLENVPPQAMRGFQNPRSRFARRFQAAYNRARRLGESIPLAIQEAVQRVGLGRVTNPYRVERLASPKRFDSRSFRTVASGTHRITVGCPKGYFHTGRCRHGMRAQRVLHPKGENPKRRKYVLAVVEREERRIRQAYLRALRDPKNWRDVQMGDPAAVTKRADEIRQQVIRRYYQKREKHTPNSPAHLSVDSYEGPDRVLRHTFYGRTRQEALQGLAAHRASDPFFRAGFTKRSYKGIQVRNVRVNPLTRQETALVLRGARFHERQATKFPSRSRERGISLGRADEAMWIATRFGEATHPIAAERIKRPRLRWPSQKVRFRTRGTGGTIGLRNPHKGIHTLRANPLTENEYRNLLISLRQARNRASPDTAKVAWDGCIEKVQAAWHLAQNPPAGATKLYDRVEKVFAQKGAHSQYPHERFAHTFTKPAALYGSPDGRRLIIQSA